MIPEEPRVRCPPSPSHEIQTDAAPFDILSPDAGVPSHAESGGREPFRSRHQGSPPPGQREGLPQSYRMRADAHYVDLLGTPAPGLSVRLIATDELDIEAGPRADITALLRSVRAHGILQPLLVRKNGRRYLVMGGRSRLAAARSLGLATVPCVVHAVQDDTEAQALRMADNLRTAPVAPARDPAVSVVDRLKPLGESLSALRAATTLLGSSLDALTQKVALDLVRVHGHRASWWLAAVDLVASPGRAHRDRSHSLVSALAGVVDSFGPLHRLVGVRVQAHFPEGIPDFVIDGKVMSTGLAGAVMALLPLVEQTPQAAIQLVPTGRAGGLVLEIGALDAVAPPAFAQRLFDESWTDRPGGAAATLGALAARAAAERHGGHASWVAADDLCGRIRITIPPAG